MVTLDWRRFFISGEQKVMIENAEDAERLSKKIKHQNKQTEVLSSGILVGKIFVIESATEELIKLTEIGSNETLEISARHGNWDACELDLHGSFIDTDI